MTYWFRILSCQVAWKKEGVQTINIHKMNCKIYMFSVGGVILISQAWGHSEAETRIIKRMTDCIDGITNFMKFW
jgi:hypothetical protein